MNSFYRVGAFLVAVVVALVGFGAALAQNDVPLGNRWSPPGQIPGYGRNDRAPYLITDPEGTIHAFNSIQLGGDVVIMYSKWTEQSRWTAPVDIVISPWKQQARLRGAVLDDRGFAHMVFFGGDDLGANMYYTRAPLIDASNAQSWTRPWVVGDFASSPSEASLVGDGQDRLVMVYAGNREGIGLYSVYSDDGGDTWSDPSVVFLVRGDQHWPWALNMIMDEQGAVHAVWALVNDTGNGDIIYYSRLDPATRQWSQPFVLATRDEGDYEVDWPSIVSHQDQLIVVYNDSNPATRWMRRSFDGGATWTDPVLPFNHVGEYAHAAYAVDSGGYLHMLLGNRTGSNTNGMWHSVWLGDRWSDLIPVIAGPRITEGPLNQRFDPTAPKAVISRGNTLLVVWSTDPGAGRNGVWWSYTTLNTPREPAEPLPTPVPDPTATPTLAPPKTSTAVPTRPAFLDEPPGSGGLEPSNSMTVIAAAVIPAVLVSGVVVVSYYYRWTRKR